MNKAVIVIGMHRSGTSAIAGMLAELGVFMGQTLYGPQRGVNEKGFYENAELVELNESLFDALFWAWDDPCAHVAGKNLPSIDLRALHHRAKNLILRDYRNKAVWGMKDPRTTLLLPFWKEVFKEIDSEPCFLLMIRHPLEVYGSLKKRDNFSLEKSLLLWINYTLSGYFQTYQNKRFLILSYEELLDKPRESAKRTCERFSLGIDKVPPKIKFVDGNLRTQKDLKNQDTPLEKVALSIYNSLLDSNGKGDILQDLLDDYLAYQNELSVVLKEHLFTTKKVEVHYRNLFYEAYGSIWWKVSSPLRAIERLIRK